MARYLMAVDAGTGSVRAVLFSLQGEQVACVQKEWTHRADPRWPGSVDFDWTANWALAKNCIRGVLELSGIPAGEVAAVATTSMREGIVLYDEAGRELWACANVDARSGEQIRRLRERDPSLEREIYARTGQSYALSAIGRLLWVRDNLPDLYRKCAAMSMLNDWLAFRLTDRLAVEPSNGCSTGLLDLRDHRWRTDLADRCGVRRDIFPPVAECGSVLAPVSARAAAETGLAEGTPVVVGGADCQLGAIGVGACEPGQVLVLGGSFWQVEANAGFVRPDPDCRVRINCHALPDLWQYEAQAFEAGLVMRWFRDGFCQQEAAEAAKTGRSVYALMDERAAAVPTGSYGLQCCFSDTMNYLDWRHASPTFTNFQLDPEKFSRYTFYRAIMENTAILTRSHLDLVRRVTDREPEELIFAGGAAKSPLWCQILADATGKPVIVPKVIEATALGAAILAGTGAGLYASAADTARALTLWERRYTPNPANRGVYDELYDTWRRIYDAQLALSREGITRGLWKAPGL